MQIKHEFLCEFNPIGGPQNAFSMFIGTAPNWGTIFGLAYAVGRRPRLGWGG